MYFPLSKMSQDTSEASDSPSERLYALHAPAIFAYVRLYVASREVAEDLVIDVFLSALEHAYLLARSAETQRAWLRKTAYYKIIDYYRLQNRRPSVSLEYVANTLYENEALSPEQSALQRESYEQVVTIVKSLSTFQQQVIRLRVVYGLRCHEIAAVLDKKESTVRTALARALNAIRTLYEKE
ncbi:MAG TPA: RNA polymerase sigma factor [Ktedonobacteraceae bacterium]|nr:RNA polymerase sigma factor [Ktedonobacteraceae bacterium]